jgi:hypothetical protein
LASGITIVQVVANPLISMLGPPATAHSRLTFAQAFNSLGTTIFPYVGSILISAPWLRSALAAVGDRAGRVSRSGDACHRHHLSGAGRRAGASSRPPSGCSAIELVETPLVDVTTGIAA